MSRAESMRRVWQAACLRRFCAAWLLACGAALLASGCAPMVPVIQGMLINAAPDLLASSFGDYSTRSEFKEAVPFINARDWLGLSVLARQKLDREPNRGQWWQLAGYAHMQLGETAVARDCFERVTRLLPEEVAGWNLYAYTLRALGDRRGAMAAVDKAIQTDPGSAPAFVILGELHRDAGRVQPATQAYERALEINRQEPLAWYGLGMLGKRYNQVEMYERARKNLRQLNPSLAEQLEKA